jgi:YVTN family beta-propeller protein
MKQRLNLKMAFVAIFIFLPLVLALGCKPRGGGGVTGTAVYIPNGGPQSGDQILVVDETTVNATDIMAQSAKIHWVTNFPSTSVVEYGLSSNYTKTTNEDKTKVLRHTVELYSLFPDKTYHYRVISVDSAGNMAVSADHTFKTLRENLAPDAIHLNDPTSITWNSMYLSWVMSEAFDFEKYVLYRDLTDAVTLNSTKVFETTSKLYTGYSVTGLSPTTKYYFRVYVFDTMEVATGSNVVAGTTEVENKPPTKPVWKDPLSITCDSITLAWEANADSDFANYQIFRSDSTSVDTLSHLVATLTDKSIVSYENTLLSPETIYNYRMYTFDTAQYNNSSEVGTWKTHKLGEKLFATEDVYHCLDMTSYQDTLYTAGYRAVYKIDGKTGAILATASMQLQESRVCVNSTGTRLYVSDPQRGLVYVFDTTTMTVANTISGTPLAMGLALTRGGTHLYVTSYNTRTADVYSTSSYAKVASIVVGEFPISVAASRNTDYVYVADHGSNTVTVIDDVNLTREVTINVGAAPVDVFSSIGGNFMYVANREDNTVCWIDVATNAVVDAVAVGAGPKSIVQSPNGRYVYVANMDDNTVTIIDGVNNTVTNMLLEVDVDPRSIAVSEDSSRLYVLSYYEDNITCYAVYR